MAEVSSIKCDANGCTSTCGSIYDKEAQGWFTATLTGGYRRAFIRTVVHGCSREHFASALSLAVVDLTSAAAEADAEDRAST